MTQPYQHWNVLPHGKVSEIDDGILTVVGQIRMPLVSLPRRRTVVRLSDSRLAFVCPRSIGAKQLELLSVRDQEQ
jgi:hypothetical protein